MFSPADLDLVVLQRQFEQQGYIVLHGFLEAKVIAWTAR
jgi:hypothetical protein